MVEKCTYRRKNEGHSFNGKWVEVSSCITPSSCLLQNHIPFTTFCMIFDWYMPLRFVSSASVI